MIVFDQKRKNAIKAMKSYIKDGGYPNHQDFVLYAALRGQDVRKTSHQEDGANAVQALEKLKRFFSYRLKKDIKDPQYVILPDHSHVLQFEDFGWVVETLDEALTITSLTPTANDGVNTMLSSQHR